MTQPTSQFAVVTDGGLDALPTLRNNVPVAPFSVNFGEKSIPMNRITREEFYRELATNPVLAHRVQGMLTSNLSPEQISGRLKTLYPDRQEMWVSHETIYQALYFQARGGLKREVQQALRTGRTRRRSQRQARPRGRGCHRPRRWRG